MENIVKTIIEIGMRVARRTQTNDLGTVVEIADHGIRVMWDSCGSRKNVRTWIRGQALIIK